MTGSDRLCWRQRLRRHLCGLVFAIIVGSWPPAANAICGEGIIDTGGLPCACDCDFNCSVTVDEILSAVNGALAGNVVCVATDWDGSGTTTVDEIPTCVNNTLNGCPSCDSECPRSDTAWKECDDGGLCVGGANAGAPCVCESECIGEGACFGGIYDLHGCATDDDCAGAPCRKCRPYGGDGCAANCTSETENVCTLVPLMVPDFGIPPGALSGSRIESASSFLTIPVPLAGSQVMTIGRVVDGSATVVIKAAGFNIDPAGIATIACACIRGVEARTCGGTLVDRGGAPSTNCAPGFPGAETCPANKACAAVHGPGNAASGFISCGDPGVDIDIAQDCDGLPGTGPFDPQVTVTESDGMIPTDRGSGRLALTSAIGTVVGLCTGTSPDYGPDGVFCTADDPVTSRGTPTSILLTTNTASASIILDFESDQIVAPPQTRGEPFTCNDDNSVSVGGTELVGGFTSCDQRTVGGTAVTANFVCE